MGTPWIEQYRPLTTKAMIGSVDIKRAIVSFLQQFKQMTPKMAFLLIGKPGIGKTTIVHAIANDGHYEVRELNASDIRGAQALKDQLLESAKNTTLAAFSEKDRARGKIILLDELDGISGNEKKGGLAFIGEFIELSRYPIFMTANFASVSEAKKRLEGIADHVKVFEVPLPSFDDLYRLGERILNAEKIPFEPEALNLFCHYSDNDYRSFVNDLQVTATRHHRITMEIVKRRSVRDKTIDDIDAICSLFNAMSIDDARRITWNITFDMDDLIRHMSANIHIMLQPSDKCASAVEAMAYANRMVGRIHRTQNYSLMPYVYNEVSAVTIFRNNPETRITRKPVTPQWHPRYPASNDILQKLQSVFHVSIRELVETVVPNLKLLFKKRVLVQDEVLDLCGISNTEWRDFAAK